jgi:AcrR family transcriptional regulator
MVTRRQLDRRGRRAGTRGVPRAVREQRILDVAGQAFSERGYHAASMEAIAEGAGVTKPLVYAYFHSKEGLYAAYIEREGRELIARMRGAADASVAPPERMRAGTLQFLRFVAERRDGWQLLYAEAAARGGPLAERMAELRARIVAIVRRLLEQSVDAPAGEDAALDALAHAFVGAGESLANWWLTRPEVTADQVADLLLASGRAAVEQALAA